MDQANPIWTQVNLWTQLSWTQVNPMPLYMQISYSQASRLFLFGEIFPKEKGETMSKSNFDSCEGSESGAKAEEGEWCGGEVVVRQCFFIGLYRTCALLLELLGASKKFGWLSGNSN